MSSFTVACMVSSFFVFLFVCSFYDTDHLGLSNHLGCSSLEKTNSSSLCQLLIACSSSSGVCGGGRGSHVISFIHVVMSSQLVLSLFRLKQLNCRDVMGIVSLLYLEDSTLEQTSWSSGPYNP